MKKTKIYALIAGAVLLPAIVSASSGEGTHSAGLVFFWIALLLLIAKLSGFVEKVGQPSVLGELVAGILVGNLTLAGFHYFEPIKQNEIISFLSELGVVILLFQIGLESNIHKMKKVGWRAFLVACLGVVVPFALGTYLVGPWLAPGMDFNVYLFIGAALTATSVGITARVFQDLKKLHIPEAQIVLGAAVIDDVLGLVILAIVSAIVTAGSVTFGVISIIFLKAILFLAGSILLGGLVAERLSKWLSMIHQGVGMKFTLAVSFGLVFAYLAQLIGLAPIVGAFAAGLVLNPVHFRHFKKPKHVKEFEEVIRGENNSAFNKFREILESHEEKHIEDLIEPLGYFLVPIFFILTGMNVDLSSFANLPVVLIALALTVAAIAGKVVSGLAAGKGMNKWLVGVGMVPRGEVGLIFAMMGKSLGVISDQLFSALVVMVVLTTLLTPPVLALLLKRIKI